MKNLPFTIEDLILLRTILKFGSFRKCAENLGLSQPAVTFKIKILETNLGFKIFLRTRPISLTSFGMVFYRYTEKILFLCEELFKTLEEFKLPKKSIIIGASQTVGTYLIPQMLGLLKQKYTNLVVNLEIHSTRKIAWFVASGYVDFAIVGGEVPKELINVLDIIPYAEDELVLIVPQNHPLSFQETIKKEELYRLNFINLNKSSTIRKVLDKILEKNDVDINRLKIIMELNTVEAIKNAVQCGLGVAFVSLTAITKEIEYKNLSILKIDNFKIKRKLFILSNPNKTKTVVQNLFISELSKIFNQLPIQKIDEVK